MFCEKLMSQRISVLRFHWKCENSQEPINHQTMRLKMSLEYLQCIFFVLRRHVIDRKSKEILWIGWKYMMLLYGQIKALSTESLRKTAYKEYLLENFRFKEVKAGVNAWLIHKKDSFGLACFSLSEHGVQEQVNAKLFFSVHLEIFTCSPFILWVMALRNSKGV